MPQGPNGLGVTCCRDLGSFAHCPAPQVHGAPLKCRCATTRLGAHLSEDCPFCVFGCAAAAYYNMIYKLSATLFLLCGRTGLEGTRSFAASYLNGWAGLTKLS